MQTVGHIIKYVAVNLCRVVLALVFILSGFVKAIDPLGTQYKIHDYLQAAGMGNLAYDWMTITASVSLSTLEFTLGICVLFATGRKIVSRAVLAFMLVMTLITVWVWVADPVSDCGCFGDAIILGNGETLLKNIILTLMAITLVVLPGQMPRLLSDGNKWLVMNYSVLFIIATSSYSLYDLPLFDFRPYHIGADIRKGMEIPEDAPKAEYETTFIMQKDGVTKEFALEDYPDDSWTFVDSKTRVVKEGYVPPIHDFCIETTEGEDITEEILDHKDYTFLLVSPHLENASDGSFGDIEQIYEYAVDNGFPFYCLTASGAKAIAEWQEHTGAEYEFCSTDEITLKTMIRSNPGLMVLKNGIVIGKWSHNSLNALASDLQGTKLAESVLKEDTNAGVMTMKVLLIFFIPLLLLSIGDRLWEMRRYIWKSKKEV